MDLGDFGLSDQKSPGTVEGFRALLCLQGVAGEGGA